MRWTVLVAWLILMIALLLVFTLAAELAFGFFADHVIGAIAGAAIGVAGVVTTLCLVRVATRRSSLAQPRMGTVAGAAVGLAVGLAASVSAGLLVGAAHGAAGAVWDGVRADRLIGNMAPALIEEVTMRAGVVHLLDACHGPLAGLAGGSAPFGLLHIASKLLGQPVSFSHVVGTTASGLLLSLLYLRWGLGAAVACHWVWNALAGAWKDALGFANAREFEGAWETTAVLLVLCLLVAGIRPGWWPRRHEL